MHGLFDELVNRLDTPLTERDETALLSAVSVALLTGARRGMKAAIYMAEVQARRKGVQLFRLSCPTRPQWICGPRGMAMSEPKFSERLIEHMEPWNTGPVNATGKRISKCSLSR